MEINANAVGFNASYTTPAGFAIEGTITCVFGDSLVIACYDADGNLDSEHEVKITEPSLRVFG